MKLNKLLILAVMPMMCLAANAQEKNNRKDFTPKKGDFTVAATVGYNSYASVQAQSGLQTNYEAEAFSTNWSDKKLMIGLEAGWFFNDLWKLNLGGGLNFTNNPGYPSVPGTIDETTEPGDGSIPNYRAVADASSLTYNVFTGVDRYFKMKKVPNLMWYTGVRAGFAYAQNQMKYDEYETLGKSVGETWNLRGSITMGVDFYVLPGMYIGAQIDPFSYTYNMTTYKPQEGLGNLEADSHNYSFLSAPTLKIGFKFGKSNRGSASLGYYTSEEVNQLVNAERAKQKEAEVIYKVDTVVVKQDCPPTEVIRGIKSHVTFATGRSNITSLQEMNVQAIADYMLQYPKSKATITGYADNGTGTQEINLRLAKQRAEAVAKELMEKYGISSDRLAVSSMQDKEQPFQTNDWNRVVIMVAD